MGDLTGEQVRLGCYLDGDDRFHLTTVGFLVDDDDLSEIFAQYPSFSAAIMSITEPDRHSDGPHETRWSIQMAGVQVEPLVVKWERGQRAMVVPDQRFHITYGFTPNSVDPDGSVTYLWPDDLDREALRVGSGARINGFDQPSHGDASVTARRRFVEDYCTLRQKHFVVAYFIHAQVKIDEQIDSFLGESDGWIDIRRPGRHVAMNRVRHGDPDAAKVEIWGLAGPIISPARLTVSDWNWDYSDFDWPLDTGKIDTFAHVGNVFVTDQALERFLIDPDTDVNLVYGSVTHGYQWGVSTHGRVGRDLVEVDLKRLNEGAPRAIAAHLNRFAAPPPHRADRNLTNIAARTVRIVTALQHLDRALQQIDTDDGPYVSGEVIGADLNGESWPKRLQATAAPAPLAIREAEFLRRSVTLYDAVIEPIKQKPLRRLVRSLAPDVAGSDVVKEARSIALLNIVVHAAAEAHDAGLSIRSDTETVAARLSWNTPLSELPADHELIEPLRLLHKVRVEASHSGAEPADLLRLGVQKRPGVTEWGVVLDRLYDDVADALERIADLGDC